MKLDELEIGDPRAGVIRERDAVAGGHRRIRRLAEDLSGAAGREQRRVGAELLTRAGRIEEARRRTTRPSSTSSSVTSA